MAAFRPLRRAGGLFGPIAPASSSPPPAHRLTRPLRDLRLTDSILRILSSTQALARAQALTSDGEFYGRRFAYGVVCPALRADAVRFTGAAG